MKKLVVILGLFLGGCASVPQDVIVHKPDVIMPPDTLFRCSGVKYPDPKALTDRQVAQILSNLDANNRVCRKSLNAIKDYLQRAKTLSEKKS